jgi:gliding motility-associated lipoprotein GldH
MRILLQNRKKYIFYLLPVFLLFSCGSRDVFNGYIKVDNAGWKADSVNKFTFAINDTTALYNSYINIRHTGDFSYRNLRLNVDLISPDSTIIRDTAVLILAGKSGKWIGAGSSSVRHFRYLFKHQMRYAQPGNYEYCIAHGMTDSLLHGVVNVGIRIEYSE